MRDPERETCYLRANMQDEGSEASDAEEQPAHGPAPWPGPADLLAAFRYLTVLGAGGEPPPLGPATLFFPLVGVLFSVIWLAVDHAGRTLRGPHLSSVLVLLAAIVTTGGRPLLGAGRTVAALCFGSRAVAFDAMNGRLRPAAVGAAGLIALLDLLCLLALGYLRPIALACAPLLGCWSIVVLAFGSRGGREDRRRVKFAPRITFREFGVASTFTFALIFWATGFLGILLVLVTALAIIGLRILIHRRFEGVTDASLGAACELAQLVPLGLLALF